MIRPVILILIVALGVLGASSLFLSEALSISEEGLFDVEVRAGGGLTRDDLDGVSVVVVTDESGASSLQPAASSAKVSAAPNATRRWRRRTVSEVGFGAGSTVMVMRIGHSVPAARFPGGRFGHPQ